MNYFDLDAVVLEVVHAPTLKKQERHNEGTQTALMSTESLLQQDGGDNHNKRENWRAHII